MAPVSGVGNAEKRIRGINIHRTTRPALAVWRHRCLRSHLRLLFSPAFACPVGLSPGGQDVGVAPKTTQQRDGPLLVLTFCPFPHSPEQLTVVAASHPSKPAPRRPNASWRSWRTFAKVTNEQLANTLSLQCASIPDGQKYEEWLKHKENHGEDGKNNSPA